MTYTTTYPVAGMTCQNCVKHVTTELADIPGVTKVDVDLVPDGVSQVTVTSAQQIAPETAHAAIDEAGYTVAS